MTAADESGAATVVSLLSLVSSTTVAIVLTLISGAAGEVSPEVGDVLGVLEAVFKDAVGSRAVVVTGATRVITSSVVAGDTGVAGAAVVITATFVVGLSAVVVGGAVAVVSDVVISGLRVGTVDLGVVVVALI